MTTEVPSVVQEVLESPFMRRFTDNPQKLAPVIVDILKEHPTTIGVREALCEKGLSAELSEQMEQLTPREQKGVWWVAMKCAGLNLTDSVDEEHVERVQKLVQAAKLRQCGPSFFDSSCSLNYFGTSQENIWNKLDDFLTPAMRNVVNLSSEEKRLNKWAHYFSVEQREVLCELAQKISRKYALVDDMIDFIAKRKSEQKEQFPELKKLTVKETDFVMMAAWYQTSVDEEHPPLMKRCARGIQQLYNDLMAQNKITHSR